MPLFGRGFPLPPLGLVCGQGRRPGLNGHCSDKTVSRKKGRKWQEEEAEKHGRAPLPVLLTPRVDNVPQRPL